jgi:cytochrome c2
LSKPIVHDHNSDGLDRNMLRAQKGPGPMRVADDELGSVLGITDVKSVTKPRAWPSWTPLRPENSRMLRQHQPHIVGAVLAGFVLMAAGSSLVVPARAQAKADAKALFEKRCGGCHALDRDKEGPRLGGVYGRTAGLVGSFQYSDALKKSGVRWTEETLNKWLTDTEKLVPDNDMTFRVERADERSEIIAYLKQNSGK